MECVDDFRFVLDITSRNQLHDYTTQTRLMKRQSEDWSTQQLGQLEAKDHIPKDDENQAMLIELMDRAILDKRCMERGKKDGGEHGDQGES